MGEFTDKIAVITGGASGIGKSTAALIAKEGGSVVICDCRDDAVEDTLAEYADRFPSIRGQVADVASAADMERLIEAPLAHLDHLLITSSQRLAQLRFARRRQAHRAFDLSVVGLQWDYTAAALGQVLQLSFQ